MKVESFYCEHTSSLIGGKSARSVALEHAIKTLNENLQQGLHYKCNYDAFVEIKPGCWRKLLRMLMRRKKEKVITVKFKYGIFDKMLAQESRQFELIEVHPVSAEHELGTFDKNQLQNKYLETGKNAVQEFLDTNPKIRPYCDLEIMVKIKPGCLPKILNILSGNSHRNKFSYKYYEFNIAQKFA